MGPTGREPQSLVPSPSRPARDLLRRRAHGRPRSGRFKHCVCTDPFAAVVGTKRGSGRYDNEPVYRDPPPSSASPIRSLADFERRLRPDVVVVLDWLDPLGQVRRRTRGNVVAVDGGHPTPFAVRDGERLNYISSGREPRSAYDLSGATITLRPSASGGWRLTILDESSAGPPLEKRKATRPITPNPSPAAMDRLQRRLLQLTGLRRSTRWRWWRNPGGPLFCWTTHPANDGSYFSFAWLPVGRGARAGRAADYELAEDSLYGSPLRREARERASLLLKQYRAGNRKPWR